MSFLSRATLKYGRLSLLTVLVTAPACGAEPLSAHQQLTQEIFRELIEIDTVSVGGDTGRAAELVAARLRTAGFEGQDLQVFKPASGKGNVVARLRGTGKQRPILLLAHLDVVPARREDWSFDPFKLTQQDGYFYGRGTEDDKNMAAIFAANLIRYKKEGYKPDRDIILALTADEEIGGYWGIQWLLKNKRDLIDAEFALNEGAGVALRQGKPVRVNIATAEKTTVNFRLEATDRGGHSSVARADNPITRVAEGISHLAKFNFPLNLNQTTREFFTRSAELEKPTVAADMRSILSGSSDAAALGRLSESPYYNALLRTTCVPTMIEGGLASNALPQTAHATVNCRIMPGELVKDVKATLIRVVADDRISFSDPGTPPSTSPSLLSKELLTMVEQVSGRYWPGVPVVSTMMTGSSDSRYLRDAGIPTYGHSGLASAETRAHGKDERVSIKAFFESGEYLYELVRALAGGK